MKPKIYSVENFNSAKKVLDEVVPLKPKFITHAQALKALKKVLDDMHLNKHYDHKEITNLLKKNGIKATQKEVRLLLKTRDHPLIKKA